MKNLINHFLLKTFSFLRLPLVKKILSLQLIEKGSVLLCNFYLENSTPSRAHVRTNTERSQRCGFAYLDVWVVEYLKVDVVDPLFLTRKKVNRV